MSSMNFSRRAWRTAFHAAVGFAAVLIPAVGPHAACAAAAPAPPAADLILRAGEEGTAFKSLTVEGEDRIHVDYARPELTLALAPESAPRLDLGTIEDVLDRTIPDLDAPLLTVSAGLRSPYSGRPWLAEFATGPLAVFRPAVQGAERWRLEIVDGRGAPVAAVEGAKRPPEAIPWDGRTLDGGTAVPGRTYSYVFTAHDRAGNKRTFVGNGFEVPAYRREVEGRPVLVFPGSALVVPGGRAPASSGVALTPPVLLEAASWINQRTTVGQVSRVTATARSSEGASHLAARTIAILSGLVPGGEARFESGIQVEADAPVNGVVAITPAGRAMGASTARPK